MCDADRQADAMWGFPDSWMLCKCDGVSGVVSRQQGHVSSYVEKDITISVTTPIKMLFVYTFDEFGMSFASGGVSR